MRGIIQISLVIGSLAMIAATPVQAVGTRYPYLCVPKTLFELMP
jgi:hypothetical protein